MTIEEQICDHDDQRKMLKRELCQKKVAAKAGDKAAKDNIPVYKKLIRDHTEAIRQLERKRKLSK